MNNLLGRLPNGKIQIIVHELRSMSHTAFLFALLHRILNNSIVMAPIQKSLFLDFLKKI